MGRTSGGSRSGRSGALQNEQRNERESGTHWNPLWDRCVLGDSHRDAGNCIIMKKASGQKADISV